MNEKMPMWEWKCSFSVILQSNYQMSLFHFPGCFILMTSEAKLAHAVSTKSILCQVAISHGSGEPERRGVGRVQPHLQSSLQLIWGCLSIGWTPIVYKCQSVLHKQPNSNMNKNKNEIKTIYDSATASKIILFFHVKYTFYVVLCHKYKFVFHFFTSQIILNFFC